MHVIPTMIIGGGVAGASLACCLAEKGKASGVRLVDVDLFGRFSSSELNGGGVRCTFAEPLNVRLSLHSARYYMQHAEQFDFRQRGYLWMYDEDLWAEARGFLPVVRSFDLPVEELSPGELKRRIPILDDVSDLAGATLTPFDGRLSPHRLRMHYLNQAQAGGVELLDRWEVAAIEGERPPYVVTLRRVPPQDVLAVLEGGVPQVGVLADLCLRSLTPQVSEYRDLCHPPAGRETLIVQALRIVNAAGPWAPRVARLYGRELPVTPMPRQVFLLEHPRVNLEPLPFFIDYPQDIYFRHYQRDGRDCTLVSWSDPAEPHRIDFSYHSEAYYHRHVEPLLTRRIAALGEARLAGGWVGHYELSPDKSAVIGPVPGRPEVYNYSGLSAHGVMQSRALGEALAELLVRGRWPAGLELDKLSESRFAGGSRAMERMYV